MDKKSYIGLAFLLGISLVFLSTVSHANAAGSSRRTCVIAARTIFTTAINQNDQTYIQAKDTAQTTFTAALQQAGSNSTAIRAAHATYNAALKAARSAFTATKKSVTSQLRISQKACGPRK